MKFEINLEFKVGQRVYYTPMVMSSGNPVNKGYARIDKIILQGYMKKHTKKMCLEPFIYVLKLESNDIVRPAASPFEIRKLIKGK